MNRKVRHSINSILAGIAFTMGVAVVSIPILGSDVEAKNQFILLGIAVLALGFLALNKEKDKKTE